MTTYWESKIILKYEEIFESNNFSKSNHKFRCDTCVATFIRYLIL